MIPEIFNKKYDLIYASVVLQHIVDDNIYSKIVELLSKNCKYLIIVQHKDIPVKLIVDNYFTMIHKETYVGNFPNNILHNYLIYKSI